MSTPGIDKDFQTRVREILEPAGGLDVKIKDFTALLSAFLDGAAVHVLLYAEELGEFVMMGSTQRWRPPAPPPRFAVSGTSESLALRERRTVYLQETQRPTGSRLKAQQFVFPLVIEDPLVGVVTVACISEKGIDPRRVLFAERAVQQLGGAVLKTLREESSARQIMKISAISEAGVTIISARELGNLAQLIVAIAPMILEAESCVLRLLDEESQKFTVRDTFGIRGDETQKILLHIDRLAAFEVARTGQPLLVRNLAEEERFREHTLYAQTLICHPLLRDGQVIGTVTLFNKTGNGTLYQGHFTREDLATCGKLMKFAEKAIAAAIAAQRSDELRTHDEVTGLPNLKHFKQRLLGELNRAQRFRKKLVLIFCEAAADAAREGPLDPQQLDRLDRRIADGIRGATRQYDVAGWLGKHRFAILLPEFDTGSAAALARIRQRLEEEVRKHSPDGRVALKFVHATYPDDGEKYEQLIFDNNLF
jgi:diguanylate cyclase (GGDEF)-like protein